MELALNEQQRMIQASARRFFHSIGGIEVAKRYRDGDRQAIYSVWEGLAELEYLGLMIPEECGGLGLGPVYLIPVLEEAGRVLAPGPIAETCLCATALASRLAGESQKSAMLSGIARGECRATICFNGSETPGSAPRPSVHAVCSADGYLLSGIVSPVWHAKEADLFLVTAAVGESEEGRIAVFAVPVSTDGISIRARHSLDPSLGVCDVAFQRVPIGPDARLASDERAFQRALDVTAVGLCSLAVGGMEQLVDMSVEHAKTRVQFGQPVGRFQAVKHRIVEMKIRLETARSLSYYAAWCLDTDQPNAGVAVSAAKAYSSTAYVQAALENIQNLGGTGFSYEHDAHLYLRRAKALENYIGGPAEHRRRIAAYLRELPARGAEPSAEPSRDTAPENVGAYR